MPWVYVGNPATLVWICEPDPYYTCGPVCDPYWSNVVLMMHCNGANNGTLFYDDSEYHRALTPGGATTITSQFKFGSASLNINGNSLRVTTPAAPELSFGSGDFTIEFWLYYPVSQGSFGNIFMNKRAGSVSGFEWQIQAMGGSTNVNLTLSSGVSQLGSSQVTGMTIGTWNHIAFCRKDGVLTGFMNGIPNTPTGGAGVLNTTSPGILIVGTELSNPDLWSKSYIDDLRITNGVARYTGPFFIPTSAHPDCQELYSSGCDPHWNDVILLLDGSSTLTTDSSPYNSTLLTNGGPFLDSGNQLFGRPTYAIDLVGTDYVGIASDVLYMTALGNKEWTLELWIRPLSAGVQNTIFSFGRFQFAWYADGHVNAFCNDIGGSSVTVGSSAGVAPAGQWTHVALCRDNSGPTFSDLKLYINGVNVTTSTGHGKSSTIGTNAGFGRLIGYNNNGVAGNFTGLRLTKNIARYRSAGFTTPTDVYPTCLTDGENIEAATVLLLHGDGTGTDTGLLDSSIYQQIPTPSLTRISDVQKKFGTGSLLFPTSASIMTYPASTRWHFLANDFTIEMWLFTVIAPPTGGSYQGIIGLRDSNGSNNSWILHFNGDQGGRLRFEMSTSGSGATHALNSNTTIPTNTWTHVAISRNGPSVRMFINGVVQTDVANVGTSSWFVANIPLHFGVLSRTIASYNFQGYLDEVRIINGIGLYSRTFTPPTEPYPDPPTKAPRTVLSLHANSIPDETDPYAANVVLYLRGTGPNGSTTITDSSSYNHTVTVVGSNAISTTQAAFGTSSLLGTAGGYFRVAMGANGSMTGDFTIEMWAYNGGNNVVFYSESGGGYLYNGLFQAYGGTSLAITTNFTGWHHLAICRVGTTLYAFYDGVLSGTQTYAGTIDLSTLRFGMFVPNNNLHWTGHWDDIRITKGVGRYTASFPVSRGLPTIDSSCYAPKTALMYNGATVSAAEKKFGPTSFNLVQTGTSLDTGIIVSDHMDLDFGMRDFTIETWAYRTSNAYVGYLFRYNEQSTFAFTVGTNGLITLYYSSSGAALQTVNTSFAFTLNVWHHVVVQRRGGAFECYVDGASVASTPITGGGVATVNSSGSLVVGRSNAAGTSIWTGYIDEFHVTAGVALYPNGTIPTTQFPTNALDDPHYNNVVLLLNMGGTHGSTTLVDSSIYNRSPTTTVGPASIDTNVRKFSTGAMNFTGGYFWYDDSDDFDVGAGDWTVEGWCLLNAQARDGNSRSILLGYQSETNGGLYPYTITVNTTGTLSVAGYNTADGVAFSVVSTNVISAGVWYHVALQRAGSVITLFMNGVVWATTSVSGTLKNSPRYLGIGIAGEYVSVGYGGTFGVRMMGWIDSYRFTKGVARYPISFTPGSLQWCDSRLPTLGFGTPSPGGGGGDPLFNDVVFLLDADSGTLVDASKYASTITLSANPPTANALSKWGVRSVRLTGINCSGTAPNVGLLNVPATAAWTLETWIYISTASGFQIEVVGFNGVSYAELGYAGSSRWLYADSASFGDQYNGFYSGSVAIPLNTWVHVAMVREAGSDKVPRMYMDGTYRGAWDTAIAFSAGQMLAGFGWVRDSGNNAGTQYIEDFRITLNQERYTGTGSYTVPTAKFPRSL